MRARRERRGWRWWWGWRTDGRTDGALALPRLFSCDKVRYRGSLSALRRVEWKGATRSAESGGRSRFKCAGEGRKKPPSTEEQMGKLPVWRGSPFGLATEATQLVGLDCWGGGGHAVMNWADQFLYLCNFLTLGCCLHSGVVAHSWLS